MGIHLNRVHNRYMNNYWISNLFEVISNLLSEWM